jgi:D-glycerate 3-kinase
MSTPDATVERAALAEIERVRARSGQMPVIGLCGPQGSGKSTLARSLLDLCRAQGIAAATVSIDDLYLPRAARQHLARSVHPLLATRGVPGTHDIALGMDVVAALKRGEPCELPRFSKAIDDRLPRSDWEIAPEDCRLLLFEGWCVGARPQVAEALVRPINDLERIEDPQGNWRRYANDALAGPYEVLFGAIDTLMLLQAPGFEAVFDWRLQQEEELRARVGTRAPGLMNSPQIARFIQHYERLTRHILAEMPNRANLVVSMAADRTPLTISTMVTRSIARPDISHDEKMAR